MTNNIDLISFLREVRPKAVLYLKKHFKLSDFDAEDCFQEGSMAMYKNIQSGRLDVNAMTSSLSTYLIKCCCNHALHHLRDQAHTDQFETREFNITEDGTIKNGANLGAQDNEWEEKEEMLRVMEELVNDMPSPCKEILRYSYYNVEELSQQEIAQLVGSRNAQTVKVQKSRCMDKLKQRMHQIFKI